MSIRDQILRQSRRRRRPSSVERRTVGTEPRVAVAPRRATPVKNRQPTRTVGRKDPPVSTPKSPPKKQPTRGRVVAARTEKEDAAKKARAERAAREAAERKAKEAAAKKAREQAAKEAQAEKERQARVRAENQRKEAASRVREAKEAERKARREREAKAARDAAAARKAAEEKAAREAAAKKEREAKKQAEIKRAREEAARRQRAEKEAAAKKAREEAARRQRAEKEAAAKKAREEAARQAEAKRAAEAKAAREAEAKRVAEEKKAAANRRAIAQRAEKEAAQERARAAKEAAEAERLREEARRAAALRDAKNARTPARGPVVEKEPEMLMPTMPTPPSDVVTRGTVGPVAQRDDEPMTPVGFPTEDDQLGGAPKDFSYDNFQPNQISYVKALMNNLGINPDEDEQVLKDLLENQFGSGAQVSKDTLTKTFSRGDGKSLLSAIGEVGKYEDYSPAPVADPGPAPTSPAPIEVSKPPEDITSRGTVGPVAPTPPTAPLQGNEDRSLANTVAPAEFGQPPEFKFTAEPVPRINPNWSGLEEWKKQQAGGTTDPAPTPAPEPAPTPPVAPTTPKTPVPDSEPEPKIPQINFGPTYDPDPELNKLYSQLSMTIGAGGGIRPLTEEEAKAGSARIKELEKKSIDAGGQPYKYFTRLPHGYFGDKDPGPGYDPMTGTYIKDERPTDQGPMPTPGPAPKEPTPPTGPSPGDMLIPGGGIDTTSGLGADPQGYQDLMTAPAGFNWSGGTVRISPESFYNPTTGEEWTANAAGWVPPQGWVKGKKPAASKPPESKKDEGKKKEPKAPRMPKFIDMDPHKGVRETFVPRNILGQSYDPNVREEYKKDIDRKRPNFYARLPGMGYANPVYQTPTMAVPQVQFGGYGQPMPMAPLAPYAGLAGSPGMYMVEEEEEERMPDARPGGPSRPPSGGVI